MSRQGIKAAYDFGRDLPRYGSQQEAERDLFARRDRLLTRLCDSAGSKADFDFSPQSLKKLESWYFELLDTNGFSSIGFDRSTFENAIPLYLGEVLVRNRPPFEWFVQEFTFAPGSYEIGVRRPSISLMLTRPRDLSAQPTKRHQSLWREYRRYAG
jgi:hypothetical protein